MKTHTRFLLLLSVLAGAAFACQSVTSPGGINVNPTQGTGAQNRELLFGDDFSDQSGGWISLRDEDGITDYDQGGYRIKVDKNNWFFWANPGLSFTDVDIEVDANKIGGPDDNEFGVICRYQDEKNFYFFTITSDGYYGITKILQDEETLLGMENLLASDAIYQGESLNHIRVVCRGDLLQFYVNGTKLAEVRDGDLPSGDVGLLAGTYDTPGTDILFDNLVVNQP